MTDNKKDETKEDNYIRPQFAYLNEVVIDFVTLTNHLANYKAYDSPTTDRALITSTIALYMKLRGKIKEKKNKDGLQIFKRMIVSLDNYIYGITETTFSRLDLIMNASDLCRYIESTGLTDIETDDRGDIFKAFENTFPSKG